MPAATDWHYPLLNLFWTMLWLFLWVLWIFLFIRIIMDVFRSHDLGGWAKAGWMIFLVLVPYIAAFVYLIARGAGMHERDARQAAATDQALRSYIQSATGTPSGTADELHKLAELRDRGVLSEPEFETQKRKLLA